MGVCAGAGVCLILRLRLLVLTQPPPLQSYLAERFPMLNIEPDMAEDDPLWRADHRESDEQMQVRSRRAFDRVFGVGGAEETCECCEQGKPTRRRH